MSRVGGDLLLATLAAALAALYWRAADELPRSLLSDAVGADGLPKLLATALLVAAMLLAGRALWKRDGRAALPPAEHLRPLGIPAIGIGYVLLAPLLGYPLALGLLIAATIIYFGARAPRAILACAVLGAAALWLVFVKALGVAMPGAGLLRWFA